MKFESSVANAEKILLALVHVENLENLTKSFEHREFIRGHLISIEVELKRQLANFK